MKVKSKKKAKNLLNNIKKMKIKKPPRKFGGIGYLPDDWILPG